MSGMFDWIVRQRPVAPANSVPEAISPKRPANPDFRPAIPPSVPLDNFPRAFGLLIGHEGGYVNDPHDPGGETKYGITKRSYPAEDIAGLTLDRAQAIYRRDYWDACRCGEMPWPMALPVFDCAVNMGQRRAKVTLQSVLKVTADGIIGPATMAALGKADPADVAMEYQAQRIMAYVALPGWGRYGLGWTRRAVKVMAQAVS